MLPPQGAADGLPLLPPTSDFVTICHCGYAFVFLGLWVCVFVSVVCGLAALCVCICVCVLVPFLVLIRLCIPVFRVSVCCYCVNAFVSLWARLG